MVSVFYFTPLPGFFSPFPHGTCSLSVTREYLALRDGPRGFRQGFTCPAVLRILQRDESISYTGLSPTMATLSNVFYYTIIFLLSYRSPTTPDESGLGYSPFARHYLGNRLLSFFSSGYLDVSVHRVALYKVMYSLYDTSSFLLVGSPIRKSPDQSILTTPRSISLFVTSFFSF